MDLLSVLSLWKSINFSLFLIKKWHSSMFSVLIWQPVDLFKNCKDLVFKKVVINFLGNHLKCNAFPSPVLSVCPAKAFHSLNSLRRFSVDFLIDMYLWLQFYKISLNLSFIQLPLQSTYSSIICWFLVLILFWSDNAFDIISFFNILSNISSLYNDMIIKFRFQCKGYQELQV